MTNTFDRTSAFRENEQEANIYSRRCLLVMAIVVAVVWALNLLGIFIVPQTIMAIAGSGAILLLVLPLLLRHIYQVERPHYKIFLMGCCIVAITLLAAAMPKHGIVAWAAPIALSCHYYSRKFTFGTLAASIVCMAVSLLAGTFYGEWDVSIFGVGSVMGERIVNATIYKRLFVFMLLPRAMTLVGICAICSTLADRTHALLEKQVNDSVEKQRIASELDVAARIQVSMLPCIFPVFPEREEFEVYATMDPAKEVGGDFYDIFMVDDDHLAIVAADVSGKGVPASLFMVIGKTLIKDHTTPGKDLGTVFTEVNRLLCESNSEELFITAFLGVLDLKTGEFRYVNAGHEVPFIARAGAPFAPYKVKPSLVLAGMDGIRYKEGTIQLEPGDKLFQYTDGVTEATNAREELFGMARLEASLGKVSDKKPTEILPAVKADIDAFVGGAPQFDDITMLCLAYRKRSEQAPS